MKFYFKIIILLLMVTLLTGKALWQVVNSTPENLSIEIRFQGESPNELVPKTFLIGLPTNELPKLTIRSFNKNKSTENTDNKNFGVRWINQQKVRGLETATLDISPWVDENHFFQKLYIDMAIPTNKGKNNTPTQTQTSFLRHRVLNWESAKHWFQSPTAKRTMLTDHPAGTWIKFRISEDKIYSISGEDLISLNNAFQNSAPSSLMLFTGSSLGRDRSSTIVGSLTYRPIPENLIEIPLHQIATGNTLQSDDLFLFYGRGANGFEVDGINITHHQNVYFTDNTYWLLIPHDDTLHGKRIQNAPSPTSTNVTMDYGISYLHVETDIVNPFHSGLSWSGPSFGRGGSYTAVPTLDDIKSTVDADFLVGVQGSSVDFEHAPNPSHKIDIYLNTRNMIRESINFSGKSTRATSFTVNGSELNEGANIVYLDNNSTSSFSLPHFDYITVNYGRELKSTNGMFEFFSPIHTSSVTFSFSGEPELNVWNITQISKPQNMTLNTSGNDFLLPVQLPSDTLARFIAFNSTGVPPVTGMELITGIMFTKLRHQNAGVEHLIVGPEEFRSASEILATHRGNSKFTSLEDIYNEFSGGNADPTALRSFFQWTQEEWSDPKPFCVLLMGDADYDYRNLTGESNIKVPTIVTYGYGNRAADDRLSGINGRIPELAMGRFPARNNSEANDYVEKLIEYETNPVLGLWRQRVTLVADDAARPEPKEGGSIEQAKNHTTASNEIAAQITPRVEINKLYMMEYPEVSNSSAYGVIKPDATEALFETVAEGTALINYIGHGSAHQWAQERLLVQDRGDIQELVTEMKLPIWIAGTCSWGHFDNIGQESFSEELVRQKMDGAAAIITTSRLIGITSNEYYIKNIFNTIFPNQGITQEPIGVILQSVKDGGSSGELFHLFGDPAMHHPIPTATVELTSIAPDTLIALDTARVYGRQPNTTVSGNGIIRLFDSERDITRQYYIESQSEEISYTLPGPTLFKGQFSFFNQDFNARLRIPKDISYSDSPARTNIYVKLDTEPPTEALGTLGDIFLKGGNSVQDNQGPIISLETSTGRRLMSEDYLEQNEELYLRLSDPLGINMTGEVGHEILITDLIDNTSKNVSSYFMYDENSITTGVLPYAFDIYDKTIELKINAWDNANNPSEKIIVIHILTDTRLQIMNILNFPNPFSTMTQFAFELTSPAEVIIDIFTLGGRRIIRLQGQPMDAGYNFINWDGRDNYGQRLANGVYLYRLQADDGTQSISVIRKLAKFQ